MTTTGWAATEKMRDAGVPELAVRVFAAYHEQLQEHVAGTIPEDSIDPLTEVPHLDDVRPDDAAVAEALARTVVIKLNGGPARAWASGDRSRPSSSVTG